LCRFETKLEFPEMKNYFFLLAFCIAIFMSSCNRHDAGKSNAAKNDSAMQKAKSDSLINAANKMNATDSSNTKKDSTNKTK
jgi:hypothetical protein